jgi:hypothetical protein
MSCRRRCTNQVRYSVNPKPVAPSKLLVRFVTRAFDTVICRKIFRTVVACHLPPCSLISRAFRCDLTKGCAALICSTTGKTFQHGKPALVHTATLCRPRCSEAPAQGWTSLLDTTGLAAASAALVANGARPSCSATAP